VITETVRHRLWCDKKYRCCTGWRRLHWAI